MLGKNKSCFIRIIVNSNLTVFNAYVIPFMKMYTVVDTYNFDAAKC